MQLPTTESKFLKITYAVALTAALAISTVQTAEAGSKAHLLRELLGKVASTIILTAVSTALAVEVAERYSVQRKFVNKRWFSPKYPVRGLTYDERVIWVSAGVYKIYAKGENKEGRDFVVIETETDLVIVFIS
ncbi:hypothetical protein [Stappia sp. ES.058]|uniref:hypothetical protein n=1 Tax=Stappia sp. ES.058 TaxID=1881061 RepID=UPI00087CC44F|nr:hypothetical protein [Stappia sp. ES.058]SDU16491.1 hypothetical protein SAMN05428979_2026 [Stappia sp. ES.058]